MYDEMSRTGSVGFQWGIAGGTTIGLPPVYHHGSEALNAERKTGEREIDWTGLRIASKEDKYKIPFFPGPVYCT